MCTTNILMFSYRTVTANFFLSISSTLQVVGKASAVEYFIHSSSFSANHMSVLERVRKDILKTIFILVSADKKVFLKN